MLSERIHKIESLEEKNCSLERENKDLKQQINDLEQYSLEIQGVPELSGEDVITTVKAVESAIRFKVENTMIDVCHRLAKSINGPSQTRGIIIQFVRRVDKEQFLS